LSSPSVLRGLTRARIAAVLALASVFAGGVLASAAMSNHSVDNHLIIVNRSIGDISIGMSRAEVLQKLGKPQSSLQITLGGGSVASSLGGIACPVNCDASFGAGAQIKLTPTATNGFTFDHWSGDCSGSGGCIVTINGAKAVTAHFIGHFIPPPPPPSPEPPP